MSAYEIIKALVSADDAGLMYVEAGRGSDTYWVHRCVYCEHEGLDVDRVQHAPDCPITQGRAWLAAHTPTIAGVIRNVSAGQHTLSSGADGVKLDGEPVDVDPYDEQATGEGDDGQA